MTEDEHKANAAKQRGSAEAGLVFVLSVLTGLGAVFLSLVAVTSKQFVAGGIFMVAATLMFGLLANAMYRH